ncbi:MAG: rRNA adenine N-6-methyltransferase family protein [Chthoniobacteraceae bacterium]|nr:rRNA adenine N-6-methyltransferase family protein [Chthoniobacteraceae bacterium]
MSVLLFKRFLAKPFQVAYILPSSKTLTRKVAAKCDFSEPRILVELGPGEGCHTREIVKRMHPGSRLLLFEIDPVLAEHLRKQFAHDPRVEVLQQDAALLKEELQKRGLEYCDYVVSGVPFSMLDVPTKKRILNAVYASLAPTPLAAFVVYQCTHELKRHATMFARVHSEYCLHNIPPIFVTVYHKMPLNGQPAHNGNGKDANHAAPCCCAASAKTKTANGCN